MIRKILFVAITSISINASAMNLQEAYEMALLNDPAYLGAQHEYEAGLENLSIGRSALLPKINASYGMNRSYATQWGQQYSGGPNYANTYSYPSENGGIYLQQPLFSLEAIAKWKQGDAQSEQAKAKFLTDKEELLLRVAQSYFEILATEENLKYAEEEKKLYHQQYKVSKQLYHAGEKTLVDALESESQAELTEVKGIELENELTVRRQKLQDVTNATREQVSYVNGIKDDNILVKPRWQNFGELEDKLVANNTQLKTIEQKVEVAKQEYKKNHYQHYPTLSLTGGVTTQQSNTPTSIGQTTNQNYIGVQFNMPIYSGGEISSRSGQSYSMYEKAKSEEEALKRQLKSELVKNFDQFNTAQKKMTVLAKSIKTNNEIIASTKISIAAGEKSTLDAINAEKNLYTSKRDLTQTKYTYLVAYLKILQLTGELTVDDLIKISNLTVKSEPAVSKKDKKKSS